MRSPFLPADEGEQFRLVMDNVGDHAIFLTDSTGRILRWTPGVRSILGYEEAEFIDQSGAILFTPEDREQGLPEAEMQEAARQGRAEDERWHLRKDGSRFFTSGSLTALRDNHGALRGYCKILRDSTERKRSEEALQKSEERFRLLVEGVADYALVLLDPEGNVAIWNSGAQHNLGYTAGEILGRHFSLFYTPEDRQRGTPERLLREAREHGHCEAEGQQVRKDGTRLWVSVALTALHDEVGGLRGYSKVSRDITDRKAREDQQEAQSERNRHIAETLQRSMLIAPQRGAFPGLEVETLYEAALEEAAVGGDFFDAFAAGGSRVALVVGDVSGKGLAAAQRTSQVKYALRAFVQEYLFPARALGRLNRLVYDSLNEENHLAFVTVSLAVVDTVTGRATFALAGAESPLVLRARGHSPKLIEAGGLPLGIDPEADYAAEVVALERGDTLLLFTDGLTEAHAPRGPLLEQEGLLRLTQDARQRAPGLLETGETILDGARAFSGGSFRDDVCLLLARWTDS